MKYKKQKTIWVFSDVFFKSRLLYKLFAKMEWSEAIQAHIKRVYPREKQPKVSVSTCGSMVIVENTITPTGLKFSSLLPSDKQIRDITELEFGAPIFSETGYREPTVFRRMALPSPPIATTTPLSEVRRRGPTMPPIAEEGRQKDAEMLGAISKLQSEIDCLTSVSARNVHLETIKVRMFIFIIIGLFCAGVVWYFYYGH
jgi:hypothetical protein